MPHEEQIEWPSFETVLRDVAPDSPTARSLASADQRAQYSATAEAVRASSIPQVAHADADITIGTTGVDDSTPVRNLDASTVDAAKSDIAPRSALIDITSGSLPEPLAPLDLDTSSIRALLEPRPSIEVDTPAVEEALRELDPLPELDLDTFGHLDDNHYDDTVETETALFSGDLDELTDVEAAVEEIETSEAEEVQVDEINAEPAFDDPTEDIFEPADIDVVEQDEIVEAVEAEEIFDLPADAPVDVADLDFAELTTPTGTLEFDAFEPLSFEPEAVATVEPATLELDDDSLVFELAEDEMQQVDEAHELDAVDSAEPLADPFSTEDFFSAEPLAEAFPDVHDTPADNVDYASLVVDVDDLQVDALDAPDLPDSVTAVPGIELPTHDAAPVEVFDDLAPMSMHGLDDVTDVATESELHDATDDGTFDAPGLDLFDLNDDSDDIEQERIALHGDDLYEGSDFDSIAAADAIETDLDQLIGIGEEDVEPDNVIPLRPDIDIDVAQEAPVAEQSPTQPEGPLLTGGTGWVALAPEPTSQAPDPWADMRPTEEPKKTGFWANRPKFFGGDERRRRKSERRETEAEPLQQAVDVTFDKDCPRCGSECQVDLDDPIGRRVHVSCPSCQNIWYTPYILEDSQAG